MVTNNNTSNNTSNLLKGKKGLILGVLNDRSIAWGIAKAAYENGAEIALTYLGDAAKKRVEPLAKEIGVDILMPCDATVESDVDNVFKTLEEKWGKLDFVVHSIAFSDKEELRGRFINTTASNFANTMMISCYSLISIARRAEPLMEKAGGGSIIAMTYYGAEKVIPHYNIMGVAKATLEAEVKYLAADLGEKKIRVNAISSGPIKTMAAAGIGNFNYMLKYSELNTPIRRNVTLEDNGNLASFLLSDLSTAINGDIIYVDGGYHVVGMKDPRTENLEVPEGVNIE